MTHEAPATQPQRPELNIATVEQAAAYPVSSDQYPWINGDAEVSTVLITTIEGLSFRYGSMVGHNSNISKIADKVPPRSSGKVEQSLFRALPFILEGGSHPAVDLVMHQYETTNLLKVGEHGKGAARLVFEVNRNDPKRPPVVLKVGVASHDDQIRMMGIITDVNPQRRRKHDGGSR